jgi:hypothetical protein
MEYRLTNTFLLEIRPTSHCLHVCKVDGIRRRNVWVKRYIQRVFCSIHPFRLPYIMYVWQNQKENCILCEQYQWVLLGRCISSWNTTNVKNMCCMLARLMGIPRRNISDERFIQTCSTHNDACSEQTMIAAMYNNSHTAESEPSSSTNCIYYDEWCWSWDLSPRSSRLFLSARINLRTCFWMSNAIVPR